MPVNFSEITLLLGVDRQHLGELSLVWEGWMLHKPELKEMPVLIFYDPAQVVPADAVFTESHPNVQWLPWEMPSARSQREKMLSGFVHVAAKYVKTPWYLKLDTDVIAKGPGLWMKEHWFERDERGRLPVFVSCSWGYTKPRYVMDLLDDWGDNVPDLSRHSRLNLPYSSKSRITKHRRIISWLFIGRTDWTRKIAGWLDQTGRLPYPSQDSFVFYCAARSGDRYIRERMNRYQWIHGRLRLRNLKNTFTIEAPVDTRADPASLQARTRGVIYYNAGTGCAVRLLVSLHSLRKHYAGPVTILSEDEASHQLCRPIAASCGAEFKIWQSPLTPGRKHSLMAKTCLSRGTPYDISVFLDADTIVRGPIDELFDAAVKYGFCVPQFSNWRSSGGIISRRIREWNAWMPDDIPKAIGFGPAINVGVFAFQRDSTLMRDWSHYAELGRNTYIPDEISCQIVLHRHPHHILSSKWNCSCRYDNPFGADVRIIHYHGRKHCRPGLPFAGTLWLEEFKAVLSKNLAGVRFWYGRHDKRVKRHLQNISRTGTEVVAKTEERMREDLRDEIKKLVTVKLVLGAGRTYYEGWIHTDRFLLDITKQSDWADLLDGKLCDKLLAEHVLEHLSDTDLKGALRLIHLHLKRGGSFRIAVPDGFHPSSEYLNQVRPGGTGRSAHDHKQFFNHESLAAILQDYGFEVSKLEFWDAGGIFQRIPWQSVDGHIKRSAVHDRRNRSGVLKYTSLIVDAIKP